MPDKGWKADPDWRHRQMGSIDPEELWFYEERDRLTSHEPMEWQHSRKDMRENIKGWKKTHPHLVEPAEEALKSSRYHRPYRSYVTKRPRRQKVTKRNRNEQAVGLTVAGIGASRIRGVGRMIEMGSRAAAGTGLQKPMKGVRAVHRYAGSAYDMGTAAAKTTEVGQKASRFVHPYAPHALAIGGSALVVHGSGGRNHMIQGW